MTDKSATLMNKETKPCAANRIAPAGGEERRGRRAGACRRLRIALACGALLPLVLACNGNGGRRDKAADTPAPTATETPRRFVLPSVPAYLREPESRLEYLTLHYWDAFDFRDTAYLHLPDITEQALIDYMDLLARTDSTLAARGIRGMLHAASREPRMLACLTDVMRRYWTDPNSPMCREEAFEPVCRYLLDSLPADDPLRAAAEYDLHRIRQNRPGTPAQDFAFTTASGRRTRLGEVESPLLLLLFYDPDCPACREVIGAMKENPLFADPHARGFDILAVYADGFPELWPKARRMIPPAWLNGYDHRGDILSKGLYALDAMPVLYLLDRRKRVILKDAPLSAVERRLSAPH